MRVFNWSSFKSDLRRRATIGSTCVVIACSGPRGADESPTLDIVEKGAGLELAPPPERISSDQPEPAAMPPEGVRNDSAATNERRLACNEAFGVRAVTVQWAEIPQGTITHVEAVVRNNTDAVVTVEPEVLGANPHAPPARRPLEPLELAPREERRLSVPVGTLPVQSEGTATAVELGVKWRRPFQEDMVSPASTTGAVFVTHVTGKPDQATVLTRGQEFAAQQGGKSGRRPTQLRRYDEMTGVMRAKESFELANLPEVSVGLVPVEVTP